MSGVALIYLYYFVQKPAFRVLVSAIFALLDNFKMIANRRKIVNLYIVSRYRRNVVQVQFEQFRGKYGLMSLTIMVNQQLNAAQEIQYVGNLKKSLNRIAYLYREHTFLFNHVNCHLLTLLPPVPIIFGFSFLSAHYVPPLRHDKGKT